MKRFKLLFPILLVSSLAFSCSKSDRISGTAPSVNTPQDFKIMTTFYPLQIMLMNLTEGVPGVQLNMMAPADTGCLHDYQLTTKDMKHLEQSDLLIMNGAGMEDFIEKALEIKSQNQIIMAAEGFELIDENPHVWVSPKGAMYQVQRIADGLCQADPDHAELYRNNCSSYIQKLQELSDKMHMALDRFAGTDIITFHEAFPYFASEFNLNLAAVIEREPGTEPSPKELAEIIATIKKIQNKKVALLAEPQYSSSAAQIIASETGLQVGELDPGVTGILDRNAYIDAMTSNIQVLESLLSQDF